jgi:hypothetical protein
LRNENRLLIYPEQFSIVIIIAIAALKIGIRLRNENRLLIYPDWFSISIVIAIAVSCPGEII